jgi:hypothetical protein
LLRMRIKFIAIYKRKVLIQPNRCIDLFWIQVVGI